MPRHTLHFSESVFAKIDPDPARAESLSGRVSRLCETAVTLMTDATPEFSVAEWCALCDIANGEHMSQPPTIEHAARSFTLSIHDSGPECDRKWSVRCTALAQQYAALPLAAQLAVLEVCRRFWLRGETNTRHDNYRDILIAHGARLREN